MQTAATIPILIATVLFLAGPPFSSRAQASGDASDRELLAAGMNLYTERRFLEAAQVWQQVLARDDANPGLIRYHARALAYYAEMQRAYRAGAELVRKGEYAGALPHLKRACRYSTRHPRLLALLKEAYRGACDVESGQDLRHLMVEDADPPVAIALPPDVPRVAGLAALDYVPGVNNRVEFRWETETLVEVDGFACSLTADPHTQHLATVAQKGAARRYAPLAPGEYWFSVRARGANGLWSEPSLFPLTIEPVRTRIEEPVDARPIARVRRTEPASDGLDAVALYRTHVIYAAGPGDCLSVVAQRVLGIDALDAFYRHVDSLGRYNGMADLDRVLTSEEIRIPAMRAAGEIHLDDIARCISEDGIAARKDLCVFDSPSPIAKKGDLVLFRNSEFLATGKLATAERPRVSPAPRGLPGSPLCALLPYPNRQTSDVR